MSKKGCKGTGPTNELDTPVLFPKLPVLFQVEIQLKISYCILGTFIPLYIFRPQKMEKSSQSLKHRAFLLVVPPVQQPCLSFCFLSIAFFFPVFCSFLLGKKPKENHHIEPLEASFSRMEKSNYQVYDKLFQC